MALIEGSAERLIAASEAGSLLAKRSVARPCICCIALIRGCSRGEATALASAHHRESLGRGRLPVTHCSCFETLPLS